MKQFCNFEALFPPQRIHCKRTDEWKDAVPTSFGSNTFSLVGVFFCMKGFFFWARGCKLFIHAWDVLESFQLSNVFKGSEECA